MQDAIRNVSPRTALSVGLKVDSDALPPALINALRAGQVNLDDPAVTIQLLKIKAGVVTKGGRPSTPGSMRSVISTSRGASTGWWMAGSKSR
jgi:hypothetical protein